MRDVAQRRPRAPSALVVHEELEGDDANLARSVNERLRSNPDDEGALVVLAVILLYRGHADKALECLHRVTRSNPRYPGIWFIKAKAFEALGDPRSAALCRRRGTSAPP